jgi:hypothetical protein
VEKVVGTEREYGKARYRSLKRKGLCPRCREKAEYGYVYCQRCLRLKREARGLEAKEPEDPKDPEDLTLLRTKLWDLLEWERPDADEQELDEEDPCALDPVIAARAWALRIGKQLSVEDKEGDEFAKWGPSPNTGRLVFSTKTGTGPCRDSL